MRVSKVAALSLQMLPCPTCGCSLLVRVWLFLYPSSDYGNACSSLITLSRPVSTGMGLWPLTCMAFHCSGHSSPPGWVLVTMFAVGGAKGALETCPQQRMH